MHSKEETNYSVMDNYIKLILKHFSSKLAAPENGFPDLSPSKES